MHPYEADEARAVFRLLSDNVESPPGLGEIVFKVETTSGESVVGRIVERDGESSRDGVLLGAMTPENSQRLVRWDEMLWIGVGLSD